MSSNWPSVTLLRRLRPSLTKSILIVSFFLISIWYYLPVFSTTQSHAYVSKRHVLQPNLVSRYLSSSPDSNNTNPSSEKIDETCNKHGFNPYQQSNGTQRRVYDIFPFFLELDWLEIRLRTLAPYVDYFVIVEFTTTFTGLPIKPIIRDNWSRFKEYEDKILHFVTEDEVVSDDVWDHEGYMKDTMLYKTFPTLVGTNQEAKEGDVLIISDVDEIPKPETISLLRYCDFPNRLTLRSFFYYYSYQWLHRGQQWEHPQATTFRGMNETLSPQEVRNGAGGLHPSQLQKFQRWMKQADLWDAAWHCSSCFKTIKEVHEKMESFAHAGQWNTPENRDPRTIANRFRYGIDLFGRWFQNYDRIDHNTDVPSYVLANKDRFKYLLDRDGEDAAFEDFWERV